MTRLSFKLANGKTVKPANRQAAFTLIELLAAMGVLSLIMFVLISFFSSAQKAWTMSNARAETYENARIALDLITRDLQCAYYEENKIPFWHRSNMSGIWAAVPYEQYFNEALYFVSATSNPPNDDCDSRLCEIAYQLYYSPTTSSNEGWLRRSTTGSNLSGGATNTRWNFYNKFTVGASGGAFAFTGRAGTTAADSNDTYQKVIPHVVNLTFICYNKQGVEIKPNATGMLTTGFPYAVKVELTLMDSSSWNKWLSMGGESDKIYTNHVPTPPILIDTDSQSAFRKLNERTFTKTIFLGERGQKY
jgi:type II secretory pathway pseudopilin PulG